MSSPRRFPRLRTEFFCLSFAREGFAKLVKTSFPQLPILAQPGIEVSEWLSAKGIESLLTFGPHTHKPRLLQDPEMPRYTGLIDIDVVDDVVDRMLAASEHFHDVESGRVGKGLQ